MFESAKNKRSLREFTRAISEELFDLVGNSYDEGLAEQSGVKELRDLNVALENNEISIADFLNKIELLKTSQICDEVLEVVTPLLELRSKLDELLGSSSSAFSTSPVLPQSYLHAPPQTRQSLLKQQLTDQIQEIANRREADDAYRERGEIRDAYMQPSRGGKYKQKAVTNGKIEMVRCLVFAHNRDNEHTNGLVVDLAQHELTQQELEELSVKFPNPAERRERINEGNTQKYFKHIDDVIASSQAERVRLVIKQGPHYTVLDIDKSKRSCCILDAAKDHRSFLFRKIATHSEHVDIVFQPESPTFIEPGTQKIVPLNNLQMDEYSCPLFAIEHMHASAEIPDLHEHLDNVKKDWVEGEPEGFHRVSWFDLTPNMVRNAQSTTFLTQYKAHNPSHRNETDRLTQNNTRGHGLAEAIRSATDIISVCCQMEDSELANAIRSTHPDRQAASVVRNNFFQPQ